MEARQPDDPAAKSDAEMTLGGMPTLAGEMMVDLYKGDVKALLREHPLTDIDGQQLWTQYAVPLLTRGRLD